MKSQYKEVHSGRINVKSITKIQKGTKLLLGQMPKKAFRNVFARHERRQDLQITDRKKSTWILKGQLELNLNLKEEVNLNLEIFQFLLRPFFIPYGCDSS